MWKAFSALQKSSSVNLVTSLDTLPTFVIRKKQAPFKSRKPKLHQLQAGAVYPKESVQKQEVSTQRPSHEVATQMPRQKYTVPKLVTSKEQILHEDPDVLKGLAASQVLHITYSLIQVLSHGKLLATQLLSTLKKHLNKK